MAGITITEASGLLDSVYGKYMYPLAKIIDDYGTAKNRDERLKALFNFETSSHFAESIKSMTAFEGFKPVAENGAYPDDQLQEGFDKLFPHVTWKDRFRISREMVDDEKIGEMKRLASKFVSGYDRTRERFGAALYGAAIAGESDLNFAGRAFKGVSASADGKPLFDAAHPSSIDPTFTQSNCFSDAFSQDALSKAQSRMIDFRDDNLSILEIVPNTILLPNDAEAIQTVFGVVGAYSQPDTSNNNWNYHFGAWNVLIWPQLNEFIPSGVVTAGAFPWVLIADGFSKQFDGAVWYEREPIAVDAYEDKNTDAAVWNGRARWSAGFFDWRAFAVGGVDRGTAL
ncbi:MAG: hypothetical protein LBC21_04650 [Oscillospiraceae bacterium]|jgi:hypothetical protein|nr:hypothetical protein [Oscillospiraceae bacterium]